MKTSLETYLQREDVPVDIKEMIKKELALRRSLQESEQMFRNLAEKSPNMIFINKGERIVYINRRCEEILGYTREEYYSPEFDVRVLLAPEYRDLLEQIFTKHMRGEKTKSYQYEMITKDGRWIHVLNNSKLIEFEGERAILGVVTDISELKQKEEQIRKSEETLRQFIEQSIDGIVLTDRKGTIMEWNRGVEQITGLPRTEALGRPLWDIQFQFVPRVERTPERFEAVKTLIKEILNVEASPWLGKINDQELEDVNRRLRIIQTLAFRIDVQGERMLCSIMRDVTESKEAEKDLIFKNTLLEVQSETTIEGILVVDEERKVILVNKRLEELWQVPPAIMATKNDETLFQYILNQIKNPEAFLTTINYLYAHKEEKKRNEILLKDGRVFDNYSAPMFDSIGKFYGRIWFFRDITQRKQVEEKLKDTKAKVEDLNESLRIINSILRHDILNNFTLMAGYLDLYEADKDTSHLRHLSKIIGKGTDLIKRMRELETLVVHDKALQPYQLQGMLKKTLEQYEDAGIKFTLAGEGEVLSDHALSSVIDNVIRNAILHAHTTQIDITIEKQEQFCELRIADYGVGIPDDIKPKIFDAGFKYGTTGHTGLGLYIVQKIIERYGGTVWVEDSEPTGSTFVIKLKRPFR